MGKLKLLDIYCQLSTELYSGDGVGQLYTTFKVSDLWRSSPALPSGQAYPWAGLGGVDGGSSSFLPIVPRLSHGLSFHLPQVSAGSRPWSCRSSSSGRRLPPPMTLSSSPGSITCSSTAQASSLSSLCLGFRSHSCLACSACSGRLPTEELCCIKQPPPS